MEVMLKQNALTEAYADVQNLINKTTWQFYIRYGGDFEEWQAEANLRFILYYDSYKVSESLFSTWLRPNIWWGLINHSITLYKQNPCSSINEDGILENLTTKPTSFSSLELLDEVCEDVKLLINLIWEPPEEIIGAEIKSGNHPCHMKMLLKGYLFKLGWTGRRIAESFSEIERILND